jgi:hypothetical protein
MSSYELVSQDQAPVPTTLASSESADVVSPLEPVLTALCAKEQATASVAGSAAVVRPTPVELVDATVELTPVETLWVKESVQDDEEAARPSTSNLVLATLCGKERASPSQSSLVRHWTDDLPEATWCIPASSTEEPVLSSLCPKEKNPASTWEDDATAWCALQLAVAAERTQLERAALREAATTSLFTRQPSPTWHHTLTCLPGWESPNADASQSPVPQLAQRTRPIRGEKKRFSPCVKSGGSKPRGCRQCGSAGHTRKNGKSARRAMLCSMCGSIEHMAEECTFAEVEPELPPLMKKAQELLPLTLLEKVALMRSTEWTPEVCGSCWRHNPGHHELECPQKERCLKCGGVGPYGYIHRHVCRIWPGEVDVFMDEDVDYEYWSRYK